MVPAAQRRCLLATGGERFRLLGLAVCAWLVASPGPAFGQDGVSVCIVGADAERQATWSDASIRDVVAAAMTRQARLVPCASAGALPVSIVLDDGAITIKLDSRRGTPLADKRLSRHPADTLVARITSAVAALIGTATSVDLAPVSAAANPATRMRGTYAMTARAAWRLGIGLLVLAGLAVIVLLAAVFTRSSRQAAARRLRTSYVAPGLLLVCLGPAIWLLCRDETVVVRAGTALGAVGALLWLSLAWVVLATVFPPLSGLHRIAHHDIIRILRAYLVSSVVRAIVLAGVCAPVVLAMWWWLAPVAAPASLLWGVAVPTLGCFLYVVVACWVEVVAATLETSFCFDDQADRLSPEEIADHRIASHAWDHAIRGYIRGYLMRAGLPVTGSGLGQVRFVPQRRPGIRVFGGGFAPVTIAVDESLLTFALAPYHRPHDFHDPAIHRLYWSRWHAGLVMPQEFGERQRQSLGDLADALQDSPDQKRPQRDARIVGEPRTLAGYVEPAALDARKRHRPRADVARLDWELDADSDGTNPSDKDLLYGGILRALGIARRRDAAWMTLAYGIRFGLQRRARPLFRIYAGVQNAGYRWLSRYPAIIADAHAALHAGHHHLIQYLYWQRSRDEQYLTTRALAPRLRRASASILEHKATGRTPDRLFQATLHNRLTWLSQFSHAPLDEPRVRFAKRAFWIACVVAIVLVSAVAIKDAIDYRSPVNATRGYDRAQEHGGEHTR